MFESILVERKNNEVCLIVKENIEGKLLIKISTDPNLKVDLAKSEQVKFSFGKSNWLNDERERIFFFFNLKETSFIGAERRLPLEINNCRDLGGYATSGSMVKWGKLYRSDVLFNLNAQDKLYLEKLKLKSVIDFRSSEEILKMPDTFVDELAHFQFSPHAEVAKDASSMGDKKNNSDSDKIKKLEKLSETAEGKKQLISMQNLMSEQMKQLVLSDSSKMAYKNFLNVLLQNDGPHLFHCQGGKDRTGWAAALILSLLGVKREIIEEDYLLTGNYNKKRNEKRMDTYRELTDNIFVLDFLSSLQQTKLSYLESSFNIIDEKYETIENYVFEELDFTQENIDRLKELYLY